MTWILIVMLMGTGKAVVQIPGYSTRQACQEAAKAFAEGTVIGAADISYSRAAVCIPSPEAKKS